MSSSLDLNNKSVLVTGGTGSFGNHFVRTVLEKFPKIHRLIIYSRDENKQYRMAQIFPEAKYPAMRYFIGDVRDGPRLKRACEGVDVIIHAAAMKHVPIAEYNPMECIKTNVFGAQNVIEAALACEVEKVVALSTDKAAAPVNLYGATKLCSDKLFIAANGIKGSRSVKFSVVRYGNVVGSRGSVVPFFLSKRHEKELPITHEDMTRFSISLEDGVKLVMHALESAWGGEIFISKLPSYRIVDVAKAVNPKVELNFIGIRPGEKLHEEMVTVADAFRTVELEDHFVICPDTLGFSMEQYCEEFNGKKVASTFSYSSGANPHFLTVEEIRREIKAHVDPNFEI